MSNVTKSILVMIVDDQLNVGAGGDDRRPVYEKWLDQLSEFHSGKWNFDVHFCADLRDVAHISVQAGQQKLAIVDMVLEGDRWTSNSVAQLDRQLIAEKWPMVLVSAKFDAVQAIQRANHLVGNDSVTAPFHFLTWSSITRAIDGLDSSDVAFIIGTLLSRTARQDILFKKNSDENIEIIHITDPHFGKCEWNVGALISLRIARNKLNLNTSDFLALTGDISNQGRPEEYLKASDYLEALANNEILARSENGLAKDRILSCPGNHDFSRPLALAANISSKIPYVVENAINPDGQWIRQYGWGPYEAFENNVMGPQDKWVVDPGYRINTRYSASGIIFLELNVEKYNIEGYQSGIGDEALKAAINKAVAAVAAVRRHKECLVVLAHRHEASAWVALDQMIQSSLNGLAMDGPLIFLCGHEHSSNVSPGLRDRVLFVRGVPPTVGVSLPSLVLPMINNITLHRKKGSVCAVTVNQVKLDISGWVVDIEGPRIYEYEKEKWRAA